MPAVALGKVIRGLLLHLLMHVYVPHTHVLSILKRHCHALKSFTVESEHCKRAQRRHKEVWGNYCLYGKVD